MLSRFAVLLLLPLSSLAWTVLPVGPKLSLALYGVPMPGELDGELPSELDPDNPCWQNMYDDDCSMSSIFSATFKASDWIKSMPCGEGMKDCDFPEEVTLPDIHNNAGVEKVDVMDALGLKRADPLDVPLSDELSP